MPRERIDLPTHELRGTKPQYVLPDSDVATGRPRYPKNLSAEARRFFKLICRQLEKRRTLTEGDQELIRLAAILRDRHQRALDHVAAEGEIVTYVRLDVRGEPHDVVKENLWLRCAKDSEKQLVAILDRLGLTPAARGKIKQTEKPKPPDETFPSREAAPAPEPEVDLASIPVEDVQ